MKILGCSVFALLAAVCLAGFFSGAAKPAARPPAAPALSRMSSEDREVVQRDSLHANASPTGLLARVNAPEYRRTAELSLKVGDCVKAEDDLEGKLEKIRGEILDMLMEGTEGSRRCALRVLIPAPAFRAFVCELRAMGKVQAEKITAAKIKGAGGAAAEEVDPRELCLVAIRMADEKVAQAVLEGRGTLAASFDRSASHLMMGAAVLVEGFGYVLPFALLGAVLLVPALVIRRFRR